MQVTYILNPIGITLPNKAAIIVKVNKRIKPHILVGIKEHKHCFKCNCFKPLSYFSKDNSTWDKLNFYCKDCRKEMQDAHNDRP